MDETALNLVIRKVMTSSPTLEIDRHDDLYLILRANHLSFVRRCVDHQPQLNLTKFGGKMDS